MTSETRRTVFLIALINVLWTPVNLFLRFATDDGASPNAIAAIRWTALSVVLGTCLQFPAFKRLTRASWPVRKDLAGAMLAGALFFAPAHLTYYRAISETSTTEASVLGSSAPVFVAVLSFLFLREKASRQRVAAIFVGFVGVWFVSIGFALPHLDTGHTVGNLKYLLGVLLECIAGIYTTQLLRRSSGITILWCMVTGAVFTFWLACLAMPGSFSLHGTTFVSAAAILYLVFVAGLFNFGVWFTTVERAPLSVMAITLMVQAPLSALLAWMVRGEQLTLAICVGSLLIMGALALGAVGSKLSPVEVDQA